MAVENQSWEAFEENRIELEWLSIPDLDADPTGATPLDLSGRIVKFSLASIFNGAPLRSNPKIAARSDDGSGTVTIPDPSGAGGSDPHVRVTLEAADTTSFASAGATAYHVQLEVLESDGSRPVIVATGTLTLKTNTQD